MEDKKIDYVMADNIKLYKAIRPNISTSKQNVLYFNSTESEDNAMILQLIDLAQNGSSVNSNFVSLKANMTYGDGLELVTPTPESVAFIDKINKTGDNINDIYKKMSTDFSLAEAAALQVLYDSEGKIANLYHVPIENVRAESPNTYGSVDNWLLSNRWGDIANKSQRRISTKNYATKIPTFNPENWEEDMGIQLMYLKKYTTGSAVYAIPSYVSSMNWIELDYEISQYLLNSVTKGYFPAGMVILNGTPSEDEKLKFKNDFNALYQGSNGSKLFFIWTTDEGDKPTFEPIQSDSDTKGFIELLTACNQAVATAHQGSLELAGIYSGQQTLGGDSTKIATEIGRYQRTVIDDFQTTLLSGLNKIMNHNELSEVNVIFKPLSVEIELPEDTTQTQNKKENV